MVDDNLEYRLKDEGADYLGGPIKSPLGPKGSFFSKYKKFLIPIGLIIAIIFVYKILSWFSGSNQTIQNPQQQTITKPTSQPVQNVTVPPPVPSATQLLMQQNDAMKQKVDAVTEQLQTTQGTVTALNDIINQNKNDLQTLSKTVDTLNASVQTLTQNMQEINAKLTKPAKSKRLVRVRYRRLTYHVKAIVPGRVWLESSDGEEVSLKQGDRLNDYGRVVNINPKDGIVKMSNGKIIKYGLNDF